MVHISEKNEMIITWLEEVQQQPKKFKLEMDKTYNVPLFNYLKLIVKPNQTAARQKKKTKNGGQLYQTGLSLIPVLL